MRSLKLFWPFDFSEKSRGRSCPWPFISRPQGLWGQASKCLKAWSQRPWGLAWMAWCKRDVSDFFRWIFFSFKSAWIFACAFQLSRKTFSCIVFWLKYSCSALLCSLCTLQYFVFVFLRNKVQTRQKKYRGMLYYLIEKHMKKFRYFWRKKNFARKSHLRPSCTKPFNYCPPKVDPSKKHNLQPLRDDCWLFNTVLCKSNANDNRRNHLCFELFKQGLCLGICNSAYFSDNLCAGGPKNNYLAAVFST